jgi:hypothetical protein
VFEEDWERGEWKRFEVMETLDMELTRSYARLIGELKDRHGEQGHGLIEEGNSVDEAENGTVVEELEQVEMASDNASIDVNVGGDMVDEVNFRAVHDVVHVADDVGMVNEVEK